MSGLRTDQTLLEKKFKKLVIIIKARRRGKWKRQERQIKPVRELLRNLSSRINQSVCLQNLCRKSCTLIPTTCSRKNPKSKRHVRYPNSRNNTTTFKVKNKKKTYKIRLFNTTPTSNKDAVVFLSPLKTSTCLQVRN